MVDRWLFYHCQLPTSIDILALLAELWNSMKHLLVALTIAILSACTAPPPTTLTPYPTFTPVPFDEAFLRDLQNRIQVDDTIPPAGRKDIITLVGQEPTHVFPDNPGIVLQYLVLLPKTEPEIRKVSTLLIGTGVIVAGERKIPLWEIEVVFLTENKEPWFATASIPPWGEDEFRLKPLHPDYIKRLFEAGVITPTPEPTY